MLGLRDVTLKPDRPKELLLDKHEKYLRNYFNDDSGTEQIMAEYLKMSGMYWGLNALYLMKAISRESDDVPKILYFIKQCQNMDGGFGAAPRHDSHILHTLCAVQMLVILNKCHSDYINIEKCIDYIISLEQENGSFFGDKWGEIDTRFSLCALATLKLLGGLDKIDLDKAVEFVMSCNNQIDGGFGSKPESESHTAYVYCCVSCLAIANKLDLIDKEQLGWWLSERQLPSGGLNGRPEKLPDVCYSWWCLASMKMINRMHMINNKNLINFILACQDHEQGGFSDRPGNWVDPYHTNFGLASISLISSHYEDLKKETCDKSDVASVHEELLSMLGELNGKLKPVNPILCMPEECLTDLCK